MNRDDEPTTLVGLLVGAAEVLCLVLVFLVPVAALLGVVRLISWLVSGIF